MKERSSRIYNSSSSRRTYLHFNEIDELGVVDLIQLVHVDDDGGDADLSGEKDVLLGLGHGTIGGRDDEDGTIHLSGT